MQSPSDAADEGKEAVGKRVLAGFVKNPSQLDGKPAILDVPSGKGRVILFAFNPLHRYLNHSVGCAVGVLGGTLDTPLGAGRPRPNA